MATQTWRIDSAHSGIHFAVRHMVIAKVRGQFGRWSGSVLLDGDDFARASAEITIDVSSIETGVADRDAHLRSADFFDASNFPEARFVGDRVEVLGGDRLRLQGELTLRGITREVALEVEITGRTRDPWGNDRLGFTARTAIERKEYGLTWNQALEAGGVLVGERVELEIEVEAVRQAAAQVA